ncbi:hypothetical protein VNO77_27076 [Canavalia gladiata]|uniref:Uncharacterized protein n=1 Tax=Canavalia gladiata TaxID=3824 RepID=A0AAN9Q657_CANGL
MDELTWKPLIQSGSHGIHTQLIDSLGKLLGSHAQEGFRAYLMAGDEEPRILLDFQASSKLNEDPSQVQRRESFRIQVLFALDESVEIQPEQSLGRKPNWTMLASHEVCFGSNLQNVKLEPSMKLSEVLNNPLKPWRR